MSVEIQRVQPRSKERRSLLPAILLAHLCAVFLSLGILTASGADGPLEFFESKIRPVLAENCYQCHSAQAEKLKGELRLDTREGVIRGGTHGPILAAGKPEQSRIIHALSYHDPDLQMPPKKQLAEETLRDFEKWIRDGALDPREERLATSVVSLKANSPPLWSIQPLHSPALPKHLGMTVARNEIDLFIQDKLREKKLAASYTADKSTLLRRVTYDLTGLPPTAEEAKQFLSDRSPDAYEKCIDRLLSSPRYGERWGRHWLDIARYSDTAGDSADFPIEDAYKYRNYVIDAFNADKAYDQFLKEQIAGDLMPFKSEEEQQEKIIATGYIALSKRFGVAPDAMHLTIDDSIDTLGRGMLGLSLGCARCHHHKYDPITLDDYYGLYGIFKSSIYPFPGSQDANRPRDLTPLISQSMVNTLLEPVRQKQKPLLEKLSRLRAELARPALEGTRESDERARLSLEYTNVISEINRLFDESPAFETAFAMKEGVASDASILIRGDPSNPGRKVPRKFIDLLGGQRLVVTNKSGRLELAGWIANEKNPLTARVLVNRVWYWHFGKGIVGTPGEFGTRGERPSNPELLDYLASRFMQEGWSIKKLHRLILTSHTYMQASGDLPKNSLRDPGNVYFWRFNRQRLEAEEIRDTMLMLSDELDWHPGHEHPFPARTEWKFTQHRPFAANYPTKKRSVYMLQTRSVQNPVLQTLDGPDPTTLVDVRGAGVTSIQGLFFLNNELVNNSARRLALQASQEKSLFKRVDKTFLAILGRSPNLREKTEALQFIHHLAVQEQKEEASMTVWESLCRVLLGSNEFLFVN